jgi:hypothetical protein
LQGLVITIPGHVGREAGHNLAAEYALAERERIRQTLLAYMREHGIGTPKLAARIKASHPRQMEIPLKTLQRFLGPIKQPPDGANPRIRTHDMALMICAAFVDKLPNHPMAFEALGEALHAVYRRQPDVIAGTYAVSAHETLISELTLIAPRVAHTEDQQYLMAKEVTVSHYRRIYDGVIFFAGRAVTILLKDRLMGSARIHGLHLNKEHFHGFVYDNEPLARISQT